MQLQIIEQRPDPWAQGQRADYREIDLEPYGAEHVPASGVRIFARKLRFPEALRLQQWVARVMGPVLGAALSGIFEAAQRAGSPEERAAVVRGELVAALPPPW